MKKRYFRLFSRQNTEINHSDREDSLPIIEAEVVVHDTPNVKEVIDETTTNEIPSEDTNEEARHRGRHKKEIAEITSDSPETAANNSEAGDM